MISGVFAIVGNSFQRAPWGWAMLALLVAGYFRIKPAMAQLANARESNLLKERASEMASMRERIDKLEAAQEKKDEIHAEQIKELEKIQAAKDKLHDAMMAASRHRMNNLNQAFQSLLMLLKKGISVEDAVVEIEAMRQRHNEREAAEMAKIRASAISVGLEVPQE